MFKTGFTGCAAPRAVSVSLVRRPVLLGIMAGMDQDDSYCGMYKTGYAGCDALRAVSFSLVDRPRVLSILAGMDQKDSCPRRTSYWLFWEMTSVGFCIQRSAWFDSGYMRCVSLRGSWKAPEMVQTVQKTVESPQFVLPSSVSVHGRHSSGDGFSDVMDYEHFWRR